MTEQEYVAASAVTVDWDLEFAHMEAERQRAEIKRREAERR